MRMRRLVLRTLEVIFDFAGFIYVVGGAIVGAALLANLGGAGAAGAILGVVGLGAGALAGLVIAALTLGPLLLLVDIRNEVGDIRAELLEGE